MAESLLAAVVIAEEFDPEVRGWGVGALAAIQSADAGLAVLLYCPGQTYGKWLARSVPGRVGSPVAAGLLAPGPTRNGSIRNPSPAAHGHHASALGESRVYVSGPPAGRDQRLVCGCRSGVGDTSFFRPQISPGRSRPDTRRRRPDDVWGWGVCDCGQHVRRLAERPHRTEESNDWFSDRAGDLHHGLLQCPGPIRNSELGCYR